MYAPVHVKKSSKKIFYLLLLLVSVNVYGLQEDLAWINGGTFTMGSAVNESGRTDREGPRHQVTVDSFYIGKYPVTQEKYLELMGTNPSYFKGANLPVEQVSWFDAVEYCNRLSLSEGLEPAYTVTGNNVSWNYGSNGYRLPTEAEWEYACRAGTVTPYYSGSSANDAGWHSGNSGGSTHPVGEKQPNPWGLYDMHGNVLEWCWDWLGPYTGETQANPRGPASGSSRVYRGGGWYFAAQQSRSAFRFGNHPFLRSYVIGFRLVRPGGRQ